MSKRLKQKIQSSKLYNSPHWLSLAHNNDLSHQKLWNQKVQQAKHIQQQKQIDRILFGIVKERLFGQLLSHDTRISNQGFYALDKMNKELVNPVVVKNSRKIWPLPGQPSYDITTKSRLKYRTIDASDGHRSRSMHHVPPEQSSQMARSIDPLTKTRKLFFTKSITSSKMPNLQTHFREITNSQNTMLYDIKLTKQILVKYNKNKQILSSICLEKFLHFFHFGGPYNFKQYCSWIQSVFNCTMRESCFVVFQVLDQSRNGYLTISDIFQALQEFEVASSTLLEKEIYELMEKIKQTENLKLQQIKPTVEEIIVRNHSLKLEEMRQLLKQSNKELVSANTFKSTAYHKSMYALEHTAASREKNSKIQVTESDNNLGFERLMRVKGEKREQGLRFSEYVSFFANKRSQFFMLFAKLLLDSDAAVIQ